MNERLSHTSGLFSPTKDAELNCPISNPLPFIRIRLLNGGYSGHGTDLRMLAKRFDFSLLTRFAVLPKQQSQAPNKPTQRWYLEEQFLSFRTFIIRLKFITHCSAYPPLSPFRLSLFLDLLRHIQGRIGFVVPAAAIASAKDMEYSHRCRRREDNPA